MTGEKRILIFANRNQLCRLHNIISAAINHENRQTMTFKAGDGWPEIVVTKLFDSPEAAISVGNIPNTMSEIGE